MDEKIYIRKPIQVIEGIPVFSDIESEYIKNYQKIAQDHVDAISKGIENPFIDSALWEEMESSTVELALKYIHTYIHDKNESSMNILDVGVGLGRLLTKIKSKLNIKILDIKLYGVDIAVPYLKISKEKGINVILSQIEEIPYKDEMFDIIFCTDVLEHVLDLNVAIKSILRVLKNGGYLVIRVPNKEDLSQYLSSDYPYYYVHLRNFDENSLRLLFSRVFEMDVLEITNGAFIQREALLKYRLPMKGYLFLLRKFESLLKMIEYDLYRKFLQFFYEPIEINVVLRKR